MVLEHLTKKSEFKRYVKSLKIPDNMIKKQATPIEWSEDSVLKDCVDKARKLSAMCRENNYARIEKRKIVYRVLSHLCKNNYSCDAVFEKLYSQNHPESKQKVSELKEKYRKDIVLRQQYICALLEIYKQKHKLDRLFDSLKHLAEFADYPNRTNDISKVRNAIIFLHDTEIYKNRLPTSKLNIVNIAIYLRNKYMAELDNSLDDGAIVACWLSGRYELLSNGNLKKLGELICEIYKEQYNSEIKNHSKKRKNEYNRKRHKPMKRLSSQEKRRSINEMKSNGLTQKETASILRVSRSTVERNWNK